MNSHFIVDIHYKFKIKSQIKKEEEKNIKGNWRHLQHYYRDERFKSHNKLLWTFQQIIKRVGVGILQSDVNIGLVDSPILNNSNALRVL